QWRAPPFAPPDPSGSDRPPPTEPMRDQESTKLPGICVSSIPPCRSPQATSCGGGDGQMNDRQYLRGQTVPRRGPVRPRADRGGPGARAVGRRLPTPQRQRMLNDGDLVDLFAPFGDDVLRRRILVDNPNRLYWSDGKHA